MKQLLFRAVAIFTIMGVAFSPGIDNSLLRAQSFEIKGGLVHNYFPNANDPMDCAIYFTNKKNSPIIFAYQKIAVDFPKSWDASFCDNRNCFPAFYDNDTFAKVLPNKDASLKITIFPNGKADTAQITYAVWDYDNPNKIDTITWNIYVRWGANYQSIHPDPVRVYPNPSSQYLKISANVQGEVLFYTVSGQRAFSIFPVNGIIDISQLNKGLYTLRFTAQGVNRSALFIKQ
ncbi:MAG: hypothetical protein CK532_03690 [Flavobacteriales bacterium]|nr:MAG: hypothetical protein CK532_03690 [Flavobacteriales bacterium]